RKETRKSSVKQRSRADSVKRLSKDVFDPANTLLGITIKKGGREGSCRHCGPLAGEEAARPPGTCNPAARRRGPNFQVSGISSSEWYRPIEPSSQSHAID